MLQPGNPIGPDVRDAAAHALGRSVRREDGCRRKHDDTTSQKRRAEGAQAPGRQVRCGQVQGRQGPGRRPRPHGPAHQRPRRRRARGPQPRRGCRHPRSLGIAGRCGLRAGPAPEAAPRRRRTARRRTAGRRRGQARQPASGQALGGPLPRPCRRPRARSDPARAARRRLRDPRLRRADPDGRAGRGRDADRPLPHRPLPAPALHPRAGWSRA